SLHDALPISSRSRLRVLLLATALSLKDGVVDAAPASTTTPIPVWVMASADRARPVAGDGLGGRGELLLGRELGGSGHLRQRGECLLIDRAVGLHGRQFDRTRRAL